LGVAPSRKREEFSPGGTPKGDMKNPSVEKSNVKRDELFPGKKKGTEIY